MQKILMIAAIMALFIAVAASHAADPDEAVKARQAALKNIGREMKALGAIAKGDVESDRKDLVTSAAQMRELAPQPWPYFTQDTAVTRLENEAKATIWSDPSGFRTAQENFINAANGLALIAATGKPDEIRTKIQELGGTCGACHKAYRN